MIDFFRIGIEALSFELLGKEARSFAEFSRMGGEPIDDSGDELPFWCSNALATGVTPVLAGAAIDCAAGSP